MPEKVIEAAGQKLKAIRSSLTEAIAIRAYLEVWRKKTPEVREKVDGTIYANGFVAIGNAAVLGLIMSITRIWDTNPDVHSLPTLLSIIDTKEFREELAGDPNKEARLSALRECCDEVRRFLETDQYRAMFVSRAEGFAHNIDVSRERKKMKNPKLAKMGEVYDVIDFSCRVFNLAESAIHYSTTAIELLSEDYDRIFSVIIGDIKNYNERT